MKPIRLYPCHKSGAVLDPDLYEQLAESDPPPPHYKAVFDIVGRFVRNFDAAAPHKDDMISEGLSKALSIPDDITQNQAYGRILSHLEQFLDSQRALITPSLRTQQRLLADDKDPVYMGGGQMDLQKPIPGDDACDILAELEELKQRTTNPIDQQILSQGLAADDQSIAEDQDVTVQTVQRHRVALYEKFRQL